jgi:hypothetical protein
MENGTPGRIECLSASLFAMRIYPFRATLEYSRFALLLTVVLWTCPQSLTAQAVPAQPAAGPEVPDWALPSSPTHKQYPPPADFHRPSKVFATPLGIFDGQADIGAPLVAGSASYDPATRTYTVNSAGYNIWYTRDEFRYLWKKMSGDVSFAANVSFPIPAPPHDRKVVLVIRQDLDDDSKEVMTAEHGTGMVHLAGRADKNAMIKDMQYRIGGSLLPGVMPQRIGIEKHGDEFAVFISVQGEPMHQFGPPMTTHLDGPFYVGIGFCSHYAVNVDSGAFSDVVIENVAGKVH